MILYVALPILMYNVHTVGQQEITLKENWNSGELQNLFEWRESRIIIIVHVGQTALF